MLDRNMNISVTGSGFEAVEDVAEILTKIFLHERAGFQLQDTQIAHSAKHLRADATP